MQLEWPLVGRSADLDRVAAALGRADCSGVVFIGPGGVGKTRLANECLALAEQSGFSTAKAVATRSTSTITLGALAPLLPDLGDRTINLLVAAREALAARSGSKPLLLFVDDAHLLDDVSAALLLQIAADQQVFVVVTVRSGEEVSDAITALWKDSHAERIDIEPLADLDLDQLIIEALGGAVDPLARDELLRISEGNPLTLRELIYAALGAGTLVEIDGLWKLTGPITVSSRLADLVADRLDALDEDAYAALEVLALGEPLGIATLEQLSSPGAIEVLERKGLLRVYEEERRLEAWLAHPLYGEVVRKRLGRLRARSVLRQLADAVEAYGANRRGDLLRIATWRLESGSARNAETLAAAARQAYVALDFVLSRRLGEAAWTIEKTVQSGHLLGLVLSELGLPAEAEPILAEASALATTDEERVLVTMARSENLFRDERPDEAIATIAEAEAATADPVWRLELVGHRATLLMLLGQGAEALELVQPAIASTETRPLIEGAITAVTVLAWDGMGDDAMALAERAYAAHLDIWERELFQSDPGIHMLGIIVALSHDGRLDEAEELLNLAWAGASEQQALHAQGWLGLFFGNLMRLRGRPRSALQWYQRSNASFAAASLRGRQRWPLAGALAMSSILGRPEDTARFGRQLDEIDTCVTFNHVLIDEAHAWALVAGGDMEHARTLLDTAADTGIAESSRFTAAHALSSLARLGQPERAVDRLTELAASCQGRVIPAWAAHAAALARGDGAALSAAAATFVDLGMILHAAEAEADASRAFRKAGRARDAAAAAQRSQALGRRCEGATTPALVLAEEVTPLTRREREVALLAAQGLASKDIAEKLFLSVRTVENHLQRSYEKLGIAGRDELPGVIGAITPP